jgi:hypothetical protein
MKFKDIARKKEKDKFIFLDMGRERYRLLLDCFPKSVGMSELIELVSNNNQTQIAIASIRLELKRSKL